MNEKILLNIFVTDEERKDKPFELKYNHGNHSIFTYIIKCFHQKKSSSLVIFRNEQLDDTKHYEDLKCNKLERFYLYIFPDPSYKQVYLELIENKTNFSQYYYALIKAKGNKEKALKIAQPNKKSFNLNEFVQKIDDFEDINCAYSQYDSEFPNNPLSPYQFLKYFNLREDLYNDNKVKKFLRCYDNEFRYKRKVYEYYKFRLNSEELSEVNELLKDFFNITLDTNDGSEEDCNNEIIKKKELVLNTYMASDKDKKLAKSALNCFA